MTNKEYANFLLPNGLHDWQYYEAKYPERNLKEKIIKKFSGNIESIPQWKLVKKSFYIFFGIIYKPEFFIKKVLTLYR